MISLILSHFRPIKLKDFEEKVAELHKDSNLKFAHEYEVKL